MVQCKEHALFVQLYTAVVVSTAIMPVKHGKAWEGYRSIWKCLSTELTKDHWSYEGQGNKHRHIETNRTEAVARHRRREEIPVCGTRPPDRPAHSAIDWIPVDGRKRKGRPRKTWRSTFCDAYKMSQLERGGGTSGRSCTLAKLAAHCSEKGPEELSKLYEGWWVDVMDTSVCTGSSSQTESSQPSHTHIHALCSVHAEHLLLISALSRMFISQCFPMSANCTRRCLICSNNLK